jgi:hypothetical protein
MDEVIFRRCTMTFVMSLLGLLLINAGDPGSGQYGYNNIGYQTFFAIPTILLLFALFVSFILTVIGTVQRLVSCVCD